MGMTNKQYQGFIRALKALAEKSVKEASREETTKEDVARDLQEIVKMLGSMLEDGS